MTTSSQAASPALVSFSRPGRWLPWAGSIALVAWTLSQTDLAGLANGLRHSHVVAVLGVLGAFSISSLALEALFLQVAIGRLHHRIPFQPIFRARAAATLLSAVNTLFGYGGLVYWFQRRLALAPSRGAGVILVEAFHELGAIGILAGLGAGIMLANSTAGADLALLEQVAWLGLGCTVFYGICVLISRIPNPRSTPDAVLEVFAELRLSDYGALITIKLVQNTLWGAAMAACLRLFDVPVPYSVSLACTQLVHLARALPVSVFGIGADQVSISTLFAPWEPTTGVGTLVAFSLVFTSSILVFRLLMGLPFAPTVIRETKLPTGEFK